jgi:Fur family peroxide stress response transcriptional regulator
MAVLKTLIGSKEHLSVEDIHERIQADYPMTGLATVYKTVALLKEMGEITELNIGNDYARYDGSDEIPHPHFVCMECKLIIDLEHDILGSLPEEIAEKTGYKIVNTRLDFYGVCPKCQSG